VTTEKPPCAFAAEPIIAAGPIKLPDNNPPQPFVRVFQNWNFTDYGEPISIGFIRRACGVFSPAPGCRATTVLASRKFSMINRPATRPDMAILSLWRKHTTLLPNDRGLLSAPPIFPKGIFNNPATQLSGIAFS